MEVTPALSAAKLPTLADTVRDRILATCVACNWNITRAAESLGVSVKTVYNRLNEYERAGLVVHEGSKWRLAK